MYLFKRKIIDNTKYFKYNPTEIDNCNQLKYKMNLINNLIHNDYVWIPLYIGMIGILGHAWFTESTKVFTTLNQLNKATISEGTITPRSFRLTQEQLSQIRIDESVQTSPIKEIITSLSNNRNQTAIDTMDAEVQVNPLLMVDTTNLSPGLGKWVTYSHSEKSAQTVSQYFEKETQTMLNPDSIIQGATSQVSNSGSTILKEVDLSLFGNTTSKAVKAITEMRDEEVQTLSDLYNRTITMGPTTTLREVVVNQNFRTTHWERRYNISEIRDSQVSLIEQAVQTDSQISLVDKIVQTDSLTDFVGVWSMFQ